jgi:gamma-glutamyltranspeptidase / glutathione hydrolase
MRHTIVGTGAFLMAASLVHAANLSPGLWPAAERATLEQQERDSYSPGQAQVIEGSAGLVSATVSPVAVFAGAEALRQGGSAADAAATTALTQITTQLGSVVSYAGIFTMVYYDAKSHKVYSLDGGYNSYLNEKDPSSIPVGDLGPLSGSMKLKPTVGGAKGRETLVPGFMAGLEAMQRRFGRLPFKDLFAPALWYDEHGVVVSKHLEGFFKLRAKFLARTEEGRAFLAQAGGNSPTEGALFIQNGLAKTLRAVSRQGARYMYTGPWGRDFVRIVQREGGKVVPEDLARYRPIWSEPYQGTFAGDVVYVNGPPNYGAYNLLTGLNLAEALGLKDRGPYWSDPSTFAALARIAEVVGNAPVLNPQVAAYLRGHSIDLSPANQLTKSYAAEVAPRLDDLFAPAADATPHHSNAIVVVDKDGNIAAVTHTINAVIFGDTGIVVDGVPIPDSAAFQQARLATLKPGDRLPHEIIDTIVLSNGQPVLATASIGASLVPESYRVLLGALAQHQDLQTLMAAPPLLAYLDFGGDEAPLASRAVSLVQGAYAPAFIDQLKQEKVNVAEVPIAVAGGLRGTLAAIALDPGTGRRSAVNQPGVMVFNAVQ